MDAVDRDMKIVGLERKMADDRRRWRRTKREEDVGEEVSFVTQHRC